MTLTMLEKQLENSRCKLYREQVKGLEKYFGKTAFFHTPIRSSSKENIVEALKDDGFFLLHANGVIDKTYNQKDVNFFGVYSWIDSDETHVIIAFV